MPKHQGSMPYENNPAIVSGIFKKRLAISIELASINENSIILDIGCFEGDLLKQIRELNSSCKLYGVEKHKADFKQIENCDFRIADAEHLPFDEKFFDSVFILDVLEHIKDYEKVINEIHRVLKPNGICIISGPTESWFYKTCRYLWRRKISSSAHLYSIYDLERGFERNNFQLSARNSLPGHMLPQLFRISVFRKNSWKLKDKLWKI